MRLSASGAPWRRHRRASAHGAAVMLRVASSMVMMLAIVLLGACASHGGNTPPELVGFTESGKASYYAAKYQFRKTASGERFNQLSRTAAHRTLPFGTRLLVTSTESGRSVIVRVNDRGPFVEGRIIDLSRAAFSEIADTERGVVPVTIEAIP